MVSWFAATAYGLALHVGRSGGVVFDVDHPEKLPDVLRTALAESNCPFQDSRRNEPGRGHYVFAQPPGRRLGNSTGKLGKGWGEVRGANGIIVVAPTPHSEGGEYRWGRTGPVPVLPADIADLLTDALPSADSVVSVADVDRWVSEHPTGTKPRRLEPILRKYEKDAAAGSRHEAIVACLTWAAKEVNAGYIPAEAVIAELGERHRAAKANPRHPNGVKPSSDFAGALAGPSPRRRTKTFATRSAVSIR